MRGSGKIDETPAQRGAAIIEGVPLWHVARGGRSWAARRRTSAAYGGMQAMNVAERYRDQASGRAPTPRRRGHPNCGSNGSTWRGNTKC
jgi:hypothetical protein